jgi:predicted nucleic acid-binding protein
MSEEPRRNEPAGQGIVDTNIIVYAYDPSDSAKQSSAQSLIETLVAQDRLVVTVQVLNEFYRAVTRPNRPPSLSHPEAESKVRIIASAAVRVLPLTQEVTFRAMIGVATHGLSFWDAILWATAQEHAVFTIFTEDIPSANMIENVRPINPFVSPAPEDSPE